MDTDDESATEPTGKVERLIDEYELDAEYGAQLETLWTTSGDERLSLRELADHFNKELLATALSTEDILTVDGELSNLYRLLTSDDVSSGARTEARERLKHKGVNVDALERDFVSYQAIRTYLTESRGAEYDPAGGTDRVESTTTNISRLKSRVRSVAEGSLTDLRSADTITLGNFRIFVSVDVLCEDCGSQYGTIELLRRGGCDCSESEVSD